MSKIVGLDIGPIGYGLMGLTWRAVPLPEEESIAAMKAALNAGCNFWSGADLYGTPEYNSFHLLNKYFTKYPEDAEKVVLCAKGGLRGFVPDGSPEYIDESIENCLRILDGKKAIDIWLCLRVDKNTPIETTMKALERHVEAGNIKGIGLSEASATTIERAAKVITIACVETELSLWTYDILSNGIAKACSQHGIPVVAYSPVGRGMLTGELKSRDDLPEGDFRRHIPRFSAENFPINLQLVQELQKLAKAKGCTAAQLAIGWVIYESKRNGNPEFIPIPGTSSPTRVQENSTLVTLGSEDIEAIESILQKFEVRGERYDAQSLAITAV